MTENKDPDGLKPLKGEELTIDERTGKVVGVSFPLNHLIHDQIMTGKPISILERDIYRRKKKETGE